MEWVRLGDVASKITKGTTPTSVGFNFVDEGINFIKAESISENGEFIENKFDHISDKCNEKLARSQLQENDILFSIAGVIGRTAIVKKEILPANTNQALAIIRVPPGIFDYSFLMYALKSPLIIEQYEKQKQGVAQINLSLQNVSDFRIPKLSLEDQCHIAAILDKVTDLIAQRRAQLDKLDLLVKSRFVEMFGDPEVNSFKLPSIPMTNLCEIIDGDRGPNYPKQEEFSSDGYCLFLNAKNVTNSGFCFNQCLYISKEKDSLMRKGKLQRGDIVLTTRGTIGNLAFYDNTIPYENVRINSGMVILRVHKEQITEIFFIEQFKMLLDLIKSKMASGSAQPQLPISTMKQIMMLVPPIEEQMNFNKIVVQTNTLKSRVTSSLDSLETLKKSLMQQYFE